MYVLAFAALRTILVLTAPDVKPTVHVVGTGLESQYRV